jgi:hypothetical protein
MLVAAVLEHPHERAVLARPYLELPLDRAGIVRQFALRARPGGRLGTLAQRRRRSAGDMRELLR